MNQFIEWINKNSTSLGLVFTKFSWTEELSTELYDIECNLKIDGREIISRGTDSDFTTATMKATAEALERAFLQQIDEAETSNGIAVHYNREQAELSAICELLERDSFFCHFLSSTPFIEIPHHELPNCKVSKSIIDFLHSKGAEIRFGYLSTDSRLSGVVCAIFGLDLPNPFGMTLGTSVKKSFDDAVRSALIESSRSAASYFTQLGQPLTLNEFYKRQRPFGPFDHALLGTITDYARDFRKRFFECRNNTPKYIPTDLQEIQITTFEPVFFGSTQIENPPIFMARASSTALLNLYFDEFKCTQNELKRISVFIGEKFDMNKVNYSLHPFG